MRHIALPVLALLAAVLAGPVRAGDKPKKRDYEKSPYVSPAQNLGRAYKYDKRGEPILPKKKKDGKKAEKKDKKKRDLKNKWAHKPRKWRPGKKAEDAVPDEEGEEDLVGPGGGEPSGDSSAGEEAPSEDSGPDFGDAVPK